MTLVLMLLKLIYSNTEVFVTWGVHDTLLEFVRQDGKLALTQWKYALDILQDT